jgi:hypothetical protein
MDGTASLANRDFGRVLRTNRRRVDFSGAAHTQMKPQARAIPPLGAENPQRRDSLAERGEFELPVPICKQTDDSIRLSSATSRRKGLPYFVNRGIHVGGPEAFHRTSHAITILRVPTVDS